MNRRTGFGRRVRKLRRQLDLTQEELARRVGCAAITVRKIEAGDLRPSKQIAELLAKALAIPLEERTEFVRQARSVQPGADRAPPTPTPQVKPEEIGTQDLTGRAIRGYLLGERIGAGGFGAVYRAVQPLVDREVAIKIILPEYADHPDFIRRFEAEAQMVARLEHPHIVPLYDYWREPGVAYLVMRLLRGGSVQDRLDQGPLPLEQVAAVIDHIVGALHAAHRLGVVHRDLKPANILLDEDDNAYLADFGIAKSFSNWEVKTKVGSFIGSPAYSSPEQIRADPIMPQADIYSLGVLLFELLTGERPFSGPTPLELAQQHLTEPLPPLASRRAGLPAALDAVIARATAKDPLERYSDVSQLSTDLKQIADTGRLVRGAPGAAGPAEAANPYKGLRAFSEADAADFYGRETLTQQLLARMGEGGDLRRFLAVVGPSGSGKSSVVRAGLIPALRRGALPGSEDWFIVDLIPGARPWKELDAALKRVAVGHLGDLLTSQADDPRTLLRAVKRALPDDDVTELVVVIDQFEEIFTLVADQAERVHLLDNLVSAVLDDDSRARVVLTLRADFIDRPLRYTDFGELIKHRSELVLPLTPDEMERAIRAPAERVGLTVESTLVAAIVGDLTDQPGALPLMQYALTETFERRQDGSLTLSDYRAVGGVRGALARRADELYMGLDDRERAAARELFLRLVTLGEGSEDTRRRVLRSELEGLIGNSGHDGTAASRPKPVDAVVERFGSARLLAFDRDPITRGPTVEVGHEALLREWPRLRVWLDDSRADIRLQRSLASAAREWDANQRDPSYLLAGARLEQFDAWERTRRIGLTQEEQAYLTASREEHRRQAEAEATRREREKTLERRSRRFLRALAGVLSVAAIGAFILTGYAFNQRQIAEQSLATATVAQGEAQLEAAAAVAAREDALAQEAIALEQRNLAERQVSLTTSRELALAALTNLEPDPELSLLLALRALEVAHTKEAEQALHSALQAHRTRFTFRDHSGEVVKVAFNPEGTQLATASNDRTVRVWDTATGEARATLQVGNDGEFFDGLIFDHTGERLAMLAKSADRQRLIVHTWELSDGRHTQDSLAIALDQWSSYKLSPDWKTIAIGFEDGRAELWDLPSHEHLVTLLGHNDWVWTVDFSPDGSLLATVGRNGQVMVWDVPNSIGTGAGRAIASATSASAADTANADISPDGTLLAFGHIAGPVEVWNLAGSPVRAMTLTGHTNVVGDLDFSADGSRLATASYDGTVVVWEVATGNELFRLSGHDGFVVAASFGPDDRMLASGAQDGTARLWNAGTGGGGELISFPASDSRIKDMDLSPDERWLSVASTSGPASVWEAQTGTWLLDLPGEPGSTVYGTSIHPDGSRIATVGEDNVIRIWDSRSGAVLQAWVGHGEGQTAGLFFGTIDVAYSPDGARLATAGTDGIAKVWEADTGTELLTLSGHTGGLTAVAYSPDGTLIVTASDGPDSSVRVWNAETGALVRVLAGHRIRAWAIAFSPDGSKLATGGGGGEVKLWELQTGAELYSLPSQVGTVTGVVFSPDDEWLITGATGGRIYDVETGEELLSFTPAADVGRLVVTKDGSLLFEGSSLGIVRTYVPRFEDAVALAYARLTRWFTLDECRDYLHLESCPAQP